MGKNNVDLSVVCVTFNHKEFIEQTINSILLQDTKYSYEILIHDDCSNDGTKEIVQKFIEMYPNKIKAVIQNENQYSKGCKIAQQFLYPMIKGKYIAFCEGDDYWASKSKIQRQIDFLEKYEDFSCCVHNSIILDYASGTEKEMYTRKNKIYKFKDVCHFGGEKYHNSSIMCKRDMLFNNQIKYSPTLFGDYKTALELALKGKIMYFGDIFSVYRYKTNNSWTRRNSSYTKIACIYKECIQLLISTKQITGKKYIFEINKSILQYRLLLFINKIREILDGKNKDNQSG